MPTSRPIPFQGEVLFPLTSLSDRRETVDIFELTVPLETNIKNARAQKLTKYEHFITEITTYRDVSVQPFEISLRGYVSPSNLYIKELNLCHKL